MENQEQQLTKKERRGLRRQEKLLNQSQRKQWKKTKKIIFWLIVAVIIGASIIVGLTRFGKNSPDNTVTDITGGWTKGNKDAKITLVEYSDFQCPACATYQTMTKQLFSEFQNDIAFTYRHFPLRTIHKNADLAAQAAEAAGLQGKFWEMHDIIFENQTEWAGNKDPMNNFIKYAQALEINIEQFKTDINSKTVKEKVEKDYQDSISLGLNSTPTFFLNGEKLQNPANYDEFKTLIQAAITK